MLILFDLSTIPVGSNVTSAVFSLHHTAFENSKSTVIKSVNDYNVDGKINIHEVDTSWLDSDIKNISFTGDEGYSWWIYNNRHRPEVIDSFVNTQPGESWVSFNLTSSINTFLNGERDNHGFMLIEKSLVIDSAAPQWQGGLMSAWKSSEYSDLSYRPKLVIEFDGTILGEKKMLNIRNDFVYRLTQTQLQIYFKSTDEIGVTVELFDLFGHKILSHNSIAHNKVLQIDIPKMLANGSYIVRVSNRHFNQIDRILIL